MIVAKYPQKKNSAENSFNSILHLSFLGYSSSMLCQIIIKTTDVFRFGPVAAIQSLRAIKPGEEIFTFYRYQKNQPSWYKKLMEEQKDKETLSV